VTCAYFVVDDCAGVPLSLFPKEELAARTLRPKLLRVRDAWLAPIDDPDPRVEAKRLDLPFAPVDLGAPDIPSLVASCAIDHDVAPVAEHPGGTKAAEARLRAFLRHRLAGYVVDRNEPSRDATTHLSPYLHFGAISARRVALAVREAAEDGHAEAGEALLEQLLVRRGLAYNFARYNPHPSSYASIPAWAKQTLAAHARDPRPAELTLDELTDARSPDELWNAAQLELRARGVIHNYARMLWGKLVLTWMKRPEDAFAALVHLNDRFALDGRDPDGWASIGWCFGLHDRPWPERAIFGKVRCMTSRSARSKLDLEDYIAREGAWRRDL
jgi:deoxyribodipyrimidine photo-lyase